MLLRCAKGVSTLSRLTQEHPELVGASNSELAAAPRLETKGAVAVDPNHRRVGGALGKRHVAALGVHRISASQSELVAPAHCQHDIWQLALDSDVEFAVLDAGRRIGKLLQPKAAILILGEPFLRCRKIAVRVGVQ